MIDLNFISELMLATLIQKYNNMIISFLIEFKNERLNEIFYRLSEATIHDRIYTLYQFLNLSLIKQNIYF